MNIIERIEVYSLAYRGNDDNIAYTRYFLTEEERDTQRKVLEKQGEVVYNQLNFWRVETVIEFFGTSNYTEEIS